MAGGGGCCIEGVRLGRTRGESVGRYSKTWMDKRMAGGEEVSIWEGQEGNGQESAPAWAGMGPALYVCLRGTYSILNKKKTPPTYPTLRGMYSILNKKHPPTYPTLPLRATLDKKTPPTYPSPPPPPASYQSWQVIHSWATSVGMSAFRLNAQRSAYHFPSENCSHLARCQARKFSVACTRS